MPAVPASSIFHSHSRSGRFIDGFFDGFFDRFWACSAAILLAIVLVGAAPARALAQAPAPVFRADGWQAGDYGKSDGYPAAAYAKGERKAYLVGSYSRWDTLVPRHEIEAPPEPTPLGRAAQEPKIRYKAGGAVRSLDDYLNQYPVTGLLIARGDRILVERYQYDRRDTDRFQSMSMAKTIAALLVGIAVHEGHIRSIDDPAETYVAALRGSEFGRTSIKGLLQMSSGIRFRHRVTEQDLATDDTAILNRVRNQSVAEAVLRFNERAAPAGTRFNYTSADNLVVGLVLAAATRRTVADYAGEKLWRPLGAEAKAVWRVDRTGHELTACCFGATLRDFARLGLMLAHDGAWGGRQIVPSAWIVAATSVAAADKHLAAVSARRRLGYGYQTWLLRQPGRMFVLRGFRGQEIFVDPGSRTVMVQTAVYPVGQGDEVMALWQGVLDSLR